MRLTARRIALLNSIDFDWGVPRSSIAHIVPTSNRFGGLDYSVPSDDYLVAMQNNDRSNSASNRTGTDSQFKVSIPAYYKDIPVDADESDPELILPHNEAVDENEGKADEAATTNVSNNSTTALAPELSEREQRVHDHKAFIAALEKYGSNAGSDAGTLAWHAMAADLKWSNQDVKVYAY
jgi:hypothetical protein